MPLHIFDDFDRNEWGNRVYLNEKLNGVDDCLSFIKVFIQKILTLLLYFKNK